MRTTPPAQRAGRLLAPVVVAALVLSGCFTGKRAKFATPPTTTNPPVADTAVQALLTLMDAPNSGQYTANYDILVKFGSTSTTASVAQLDADTQSITIGHVRFLTDGSGQTCELSNASCVTGFDEAQISDTQLRHDFATLAAEQRLRQDVNTMVRAADPSTKQIAGQDATCATLHFAKGDETYCVLANGLLAQQDTADVRIDLTSYTTGVDETVFSVTAPLASTTTGAPVDTADIVVPTPVATDDIAGVTTTTPG
jgi:hypothetical protein